MAVSSIVEFLRQVDVEVGLKWLFVVEVGVYCDRESVGESYWEWEGYVECDVGEDGEGYVEWLVGGLLGLEFEVKNFYWVEECKRRAN